MEAEYQEECQGSCADEHGQLRARQVGLAQEPTGKDDGQHRRGGRGDVEQLVARQAGEAQGRRDGRELPLQAVAAEVHEDLRQAEGVGAWVLQRRDYLSLVEDGIVCAWRVVRQAQLEVFLFARREPFRRPLGLGVVGEHEEDDDGEEHREEALEKVDPGEEGGRSWSAQSSPVCELGARLQGVL